MVTVSKGIETGIIVLDLLKKSELFAKSGARAHVNLYSNQLDCGFVFKAVRNGKMPYWFVYNDFNTDYIIISGGEEVDYLSSYKNHILARIKDTEYEECANKLIEIMIDWDKKHK